MIVELEKLKQHRTILAAHMYTLHDGLSEEACEFAIKLMDEIISNAEKGFEQEIVVEKGGKDVRTL